MEVPVIQAIRLILSDNDFLYSEPIETRSFAIADSYKTVADTSFFTRALNGFQLTLDVIGAADIAVPILAPISILADTASGLISLFRGDNFGAAASFSAALPFAFGAAGTVAKLGDDALGISRGVAKGASKFAQEMADDLANQIGKNSVTFRTPHKTGHIDLRGRSHFDKRTQIEVPTPHVQTRDIKVGPDGQISTSRKTEITLPATKQDIRTARELARRQGLLP